MAGRFSLEAVFEAVDRITGPVGKMEGRMQKFTRSTEIGLRRLDKVTSGLAATLTKGLAAGAAVAGAGIGIVFNEMTQLSNETDELIKTTRELNFPFEDFQRWQFVAGQAGVSAETFTKSLNMLTKRMGEAKAGKGPLVSGLKDIDKGLLRQIMSAENSGQALEAYIATISKIQDPAKRAAISSALFGRAGMEMGRIARMSTEEITALLQAQTENGVITLEQAQAAEAYNDAMDTLNKALVSFKRDVLFPLMPVMVELMGEMRAWANANRGMIVTEVLTFFRNLAGNIERIVFWVKTIGTVLGIFYAFTLAVKTLTAAMTLFNIVMGLSPFGLFVLGVGLAIAAIAALIYWFEDIRDAFLSLPDAAIVAIGAVLGPIGLLIAAAALIYKNWEPIAEFFTDLFGKIAAVYGAARSVASLAIGALMGEDSDGGQTAAGGAQVVTAEERVARSISESNSTTSNTVTIKDETGRAQPAKRNMGPGVKLVPSGAF